MESGVNLDKGVFASGSLQFRGLSELKEHDAVQTRITIVLKRYGAGNVQWPGGDTVTFDHLGTNVIPQLLDDLKYRPDSGVSGGKVLVHELVEFGCRVEGAYRTGDIRAGIETTLSFKVTQGARLFYVPAPGQKEEEVTVGADGAVSFEIRIARGQDAIYARTELGEVKKYIRVDVYTGAVTDVTEDEYRAKTGM
jgi:hypothetical protein